MEIQFIYNAKNGVANSLFDLAHKIISPDTYECNLCKLTHGAFTENKKFRELKEKYNITLWHIDDYEKKYGKELTYPLIIMRDQDENELSRIETTDINIIRTIDELEELVRLQNKG
ncbi:MAG: hypothetical protein WAU11_08050 [Ignavibacteriaceae bacterium]